jgi:hypothetical protein
MYRPRLARAAAVRRTPRSAAVTFAGGLTLVAGGRGRPPLLALPVPIPWFGRRGLDRPESAPVHVISLGLAFLNGTRLEVDADEMLGWVTK